MISTAYFRVCSPCSFKDSSIDVEIGGFFKEGKEEA
jgi:hypothetical protein